MLKQTILEKFEDTKGVIRSHKLKEDKLHNVQQIENGKNNDLQNTTQKTKY